jgi:outer membrane protein assembly factor BamB
LLAKGSVDEAGTFADQLGKLDPEYPPLLLVRAHLLNARKEPVEAARELAAYVSHVGWDSTSGRQAIEELKHNAGLVSAFSVDARVAGAPVIIGNKIVNVGRSAGGSAELVAVDLSGEGIIWRQPAERFMDVAADMSGNAKRLWYLSGENDNPASVLLYRADIESGERHALARWVRPGAVTLAILAYASGRLFAATASPDLQSGRLRVAVDCFDARSGDRLWQKSHEYSANPAEMRFPVGLFMPQRESLIYSVAHEIWAVRAADGTVIDQHHENASIAPYFERAAAPDGPMYFRTSQHELVGYDAAHKQLTSRMKNMPDSELESAVHNGIFFGHDMRSVFALDPVKGEKWRIPAGPDRKFITLNDEDDHLWALRDDNVVLEIDRASGKVVQQHQTLWRPSGFKIQGGRFFAFTSDGLRLLS